MEDYAQHCIDIDHSLKRAHDALLKKNYELAIGEIVRVFLAASSITQYCREQILLRDSPRH